jgi:hypothetical protein
MKYGAKHFRFCIDANGYLIIGFNFYGVLLISFAHSDACLLGLVLATKSVSRFTTLYNLLGTP